jgi:hypothetical protein
MKKIAIALALSLAATSAFAQNGVDCANVLTANGAATVADSTGKCVAALAPGGTVAAAGDAVIIAGETYVYYIAGGLLLLALAASANNTPN